MCVAQLWKKRRKGVSRRSRSQAIAPSSVSLVPSTFASGISLKR